MADQLLLTFPDLAEVDVRRSAEGEMCLYTGRGGFWFQIAGGEDAAESGWLDGTTKQVQLRAYVLDVGTNPVTLRFTTDGVNFVTETVCTRENTGEWRWFRKVLSAQLLPQHSLWEDLQGGATFQIASVSKLHLGALVVKDRATGAAIQFDAEDVLEKHPAAESSAYDDATPNSGYVVDEKKVSLEGSAVSIHGNTFRDATIVGSKIENATITAQQIANATITAAQIANATITGTQIANATIVGGNIASGTITSGNIASGTITGGNIASGTITAGNIAALTITAGLIQNLTITASQIANLTITGGPSGKIATSTITRDNIVAATITAIEIAAGTITASNIASGTITTAQLNAAAIDGMTITGAVIRTAASGARTEMNASNLFGLGFGGVGGTDGTTPQWYAKASDGQIYAGGGSVHLSKDGIFLDSGTNNTEALRWLYAGNNFAKIWNYVSGTRTYFSFEAEPVSGGAVTDSQVTIAARHQTTATYNASIALVSGSTPLLYVYQSMYFGTDATHDIGASSANRPRDAYLSRNLTVGNSVTPKDDDTQSLGSHSKAFHDIYVGDSGFVEIKSGSATGRLSGDTSTGRMYIRGQKLIVAYRTAANVARYYYLDLNSAANQSWTYSASEP